MKLKVCRGCSDVFGDFNDEVYCSSCVIEREAVKEGKCLSCGGPGATEDNWGRCPKC